MRIHTLTAEEADYDPASRRMGLVMIGRSLFYTIECPWIPYTYAPDGQGGGKPNESSVPVGEYQLVLRDSPTHGRRFHLYNPELHVYVFSEDREHEWERWGCMIHAANYVRQIEGCIAPGLSLWPNETEGLSVGSSQDALEAIEKYLYSLPHDQLKLTIL